jgi:hypothetical protein
LISLLKHPDEAVRAGATDALLKARDTRFRVEIISVVAPHTAHACVTHREWMMKSNQVRSEGLHNSWVPGPTDFGRSPWKAMKGPASTSTPTSGRARETRKRF